MSFEEAAESLASLEFVRVVAHADADGIGAAACICSALTEAGVGYHFTAVEDPSDAPNHEAEVYCDMGAQYLDGIDDGVVIDHHPKRGGSHFRGILVGSESPSSSVAAHRVASHVSSGDAVSATVGAVGDGVELGEIEGVVEELLTGGAEEEKGLRLAGEDEVESLTYSTSPFTRLSGNYNAARDFVKDVEDVPTAVVFLALTQEASDAEEVARIVGDRYVLPSGVGIHELSRYVETCAVSGKHGLAFSACLDPGEHVDDARSAWRAFESTVIEKVREARVEDGKPSFAYIDGDFDTGAVADVLKDWVTGDVVVTNKAGEASFRGSFECGRVAEVAADSVGGDGGGHGSRAGASFDAPREKFIEAVKEAL
jgi:hypothetical protein